MSLGSRLRQLRHERGLSLEKAAAQFGIHFSTLGGYERDERSPEPERLQQMADFYGVSIDWLLGRTDKRNMVDVIMAAEPAQEYHAGQTDLLQDIFRDLPDVPQEDLPLVADLVKRLAEKPRQPATLAAHGGEIRNKQAVMRYIERRRREAEAKRKQQEGEPDATE